MCGIAGRLNYLSGEPVDAEVIRGMCDLLAHRGPDGSGVHVDGALGLGHRRLAIIDLSEAGRQPMARDGDLWITYNGEIYNFLDLRAELERGGHRFRSRTDTEVILAAYREWGVGCLTRFFGMFALAIWDAPARTLLLARDRLGKKPLCYWMDEGGIAFASEPKAFLADPGFEVRPDPAALSAYLSLQYIPAPASAFAGVRKLPPAHYLIVRDGRVTQERYWRLSYAHKRRISIEDAAEETRARLREAVRRRLISDVPLGAFLSGGVDSGAIVALMAAESARPVKTFSIGFAEARYNELSFARMVAERYGTEHHEFIVTPAAQAMLPALVWHYGEPFADSSAIPTFYLAQMTRRHVTVALNGDAGDENFAGYDRYLAATLAARYDRLPGPLRHAIEGSVDRLPSRATWRRVNRLKRFVTALGEPKERRYARWVLHFGEPLKTELCTPEFLAAAGGEDAADWLTARFTESDAPDFVDAMLDVDVRTYLPDDLLVKVDIASMAYGLEARSPFLDHEFMEFAASLPSTFKLRGRTTKFLLKRALAPLLPPSVLSRPKMGFAVPIDHWFRGELRELAHDTLLSTRLAQRGYFHMPTIARLVDEHTRGTRNWHYQLWNLLMFELWHQMFIDQRPCRAPQ